MKNIIKKKKEEEGDIIHDELEPWSSGNLKAQVESKKFRANRLEWVHLP